MYANHATDREIGCAVEMLPEIVRRVISLQLKKNRMPTRTAQRHAWIVELHKGGLADQTIARRTGVAHGTVRNVLAGKRSSDRLKTRVKAVRVMQLHENGLADRAIADEMAMHRRTVGRIIARESARKGLALRPVGRPAEPGSARDMRRNRTTDQPISRWRGRNSYAIYRTEH